MFMRKKSRASPQLAKASKKVISMLEDHYNFFKKSIFNEFIYFLIVLKNRSSFVRKIIMIMEP